MNSTTLDALVLASVVAVAAGTGGYYAGLKRGQKISVAQSHAEWTTNNDGNFTAEVTHHEPDKWRPKIGEKVVTMFQSDTNSEWHFASPRVVTITNLVYVGSDCQTGWLVYGDGLPGVDSSWVKPAPWLDTETNWIGGKPSPSPFHTR